MTKTPKRPYRQRKSRAKPRFKPAEQVFESWHHAYLQERLHAGMVA